jgi:hypothetical protein
VVVLEVILLTLVLMSIMDKLVNLGKILAVVMLQQEMVLLVVAVVAQMVQEEVLQIMEAMEIPMEPLEQLYLIA